jgi:hypothetical protein
MVLSGFGHGSASPPKSCNCSLLGFILPAIEQIGSDPVAATRPRDVAALDATDWFMTRAARRPSVAKHKSLNSAKEASCYEEDICQAQHHGVGAAQICDEVCYSGNLPS